MKELPLAKSEKNLNIKRNIIGRNYNPLYIRTDLRPLLIFTRRTRKLVPPRSRARNLPFSVVEKVGAAFHQHAPSRALCAGIGRKR